MTDQEIRARWTEATGMAFPVCGAIAFARAVERHVAGECGQIADDVASHYGSIGHGASGRQGAHEIADRIRQEIIERKNG